MAELHPIILIHGRYFVRHLEICNRICVKLRQLMCAVITYNSVQNEVTAIYSVYATMLFAILELVIRFVPNSYRLCPVLFRAIKKRRLYFKPFS